jgi:hypothetical protein
MRRLRTWAALVAIASLASFPGPARAGSVWDPNDPIRRLDLRRVGVVELEENRFRVTITFHHRVRLRWFESTGPALVDVAFSTALGSAPSFFFSIWKSRSNRFRGQFCEGGSACDRVVPVRRPDASTMRARFTPPYGGPDTGLPFRARTWRDQVLGTALDRTAWGTI